MSIQFEYVYPGINSLKSMALSIRAVEYTDCIAAKR